jgi:hypothetical protein
MIPLLLLRSFFCALLSIDILPSLLYLISEPFTLAHRIEADGQHGLFDLLGYLCVGSHFTRNFKHLANPF